MNGRQKEFLELLGGGFGGDEAFDDVADTVYFVKDGGGRYVFVNRTLVERCGFESKDELLGKTAGEVFPEDLGMEFEEQDRRILAGGPAIKNQLELHWYSERRKGWCLTWKKPLRSRSGDIVGLSGISRDVSGLKTNARDLESLAGVMNHVRDHIDQPLRLGDLAEATGMSPYQISNRMESVLGLTPKQYVNRCRIDAACHALENGDAPLSEIALFCGFGDQSSFTKQFGRMVGMTPNNYRRRC